MSGLMETSGVHFGTSGARGLVRAMTDEVCYAFARAFFQTLDRDGGAAAPTEVGIAGDLRSSTDRIMRAIIRAALDYGHRPLLCGKIPTPALALFGIERRIPTIMVTGSHIPDDRNGLKFYKPSGEISKRDEAAIRQQTVELPDRFQPDGMLTPSAFPAVLSVVDEARTGYVSRFLSTFSPGSLSGKRIGVYGHSAVGRDILCDILRALGAEVVRLGFSDKFIPVDTEAVRPEDLELALGWARERDLFSIVSTDGDSDRPLISDESGTWMRGDIAGILCASFVDAEVVVTPVSCNTAVEKSGLFGQVTRTRIGSPFVIEEMERAVAATSKRVVGYEANGGFLTASPLQLPGGALSPLPTRDAVIVILSILVSAVREGRKVSALPAALPPRYTASARLADFPI
jgi:phosphomannomutase